MDDYRATQNLNEKKKKIAKTSSPANTPDVIRKNKVNDNLVKMELDMDQGSMKAFARIYDLKFEL